MGAQHKSREQRMKQKIRQSIVRRNTIREEHLNVVAKKKMTLFEQILAFRFHPNEGFKLRWDLLVILLSIYNAIVTPQQFALTQTYDDSRAIAIIDTIIDVIFVVDILIMFRTNYRDEKRDIIISDWKMIAINYFKGRLLLDLLASIPFNQFLNIDNEGQQNRTGNLF